MYGHKFTSTYGESADDIWVTVLTGITGRQIADGLNACLENYPEWPPGAAQFRTLCLPKTISPDGKNTAAYLSLKDPRHPCHPLNPANPDYEQNRQLALPDTGREERNKKTGNSTLKNILGGFA